MKTFTAEKGREAFKKNQFKICPIISNADHLRFCRGLECMMYDDEVHECGLAHKSYLQEDIHD